MIRRAEARPLNRCSFRHSSRKPPVEALHEPVLLRPPGRDGSATARLRSSCHRRIACEVSPVPLSLTIIAARPRSSAIRSSSRPTRTPESDVSTTRARSTHASIAGKVVHDRQHPKAASAVQGVRHEVERPALVRRLRQGHRRSRAQRSLPAAPLADTKLLLAIEPEQPLVVQPRCPPAPAGYAAAGSRTAAVRRPTPAAAALPISVSSGRRLA